MVFVTVSLLLFGFLALWGFFLAEERDAVSTLLAWAGIVGFVAIPFYAVYFVKKARRIEL
jgi:hypothetical protein